MLLLLGLCCVMVIELSGVQFGPNHMRDFKIEWARSASSIFKSQVWFHTKLHNTKFNYHFITSIVPAIWFVTLNKIWNLFGRAVLVNLFHWLGKRCDLGIYHTAESQLDWTNRQWSQSGWNKTLYECLVA